MGFPLPATAPGGITPPTLEDWQFQYQDLVFGAGCPVGIQTISGLGGIAGIQSGDVQFARDHGEFTGLDVYGGRSPQFKLWLGAGGGTVLQQATGVATAAGVQPDGNLPLWFQLPGFDTPLCLMCRPRQYDEEWDAEFAAGARLAPPLAFHANDPRIYAPGISTLLTPGDTMGGVTFPLTFPVGPFSSEPSPRHATVTNGGNTEMRPIIVFNGPLATPALGNLTITGEPTLTFVNPAGPTFDVEAGDQLVIDTGIPHLVRYYVGGIASGSTPSNVFYWLQGGSGWWNLPPGDSELLFTATAGNGSCELWSADAWAI